MEKSHGGDKNDCFSLSAHSIRSRLNLRYGGYDFDDVFLKYFLKTIEQRKCNVNLRKMRSNGSLEPSEHDVFQSVSFMGEIMLIHK